MALLSGMLAAFAPEAFAQSTTDRGTLYVWQDSPETSPRYSNTPPPWYAGRDSQSPVPQGARVRVYRHGVLIDDSALRASERARLLPPAPAQNNLQRARDSTPARK